MKDISKKDHDNTMYYKHGLDFWLNHNKQHEKDAFNNDELKVKTLLEKYPNIRNTAIDIGSGGGWMCNKLTEYFDIVYGIEPSKKAIDLCRELYKGKKIKWVHGYSEDAFNVIDFPTEHVFLNTCSVFIHIDDKYIIPTLKWINENFNNSILSFQEFWSDTIHINQPLHNCRTKEWWCDHLNNWELDFHGPDMSKHGSQYNNISKGFHGYIK